ncbi:uncharacterized protein LOC114295779 [Camellia sinensis]|uniref:uncharacterized protein LOC114295779 n=1 Tax=Camellia sinensis TaxID=4442 RepID=UPI0010360F28|nr:uncharacterized protein LOC114295779 [Camellia sinensis]
MIFSKRDVNTVQMIMDGLAEFSSLSGLNPNPSKSNIFFSGCNQELRASILNVASFTEGTLPVKYLGVPLITTKLRASDCKQLVDRITKRINSWTNKLLSYAGRAQLIQTILFSMQVFWSSLFILPKKVIKEIESLLRSFLWSSTDLRKHGPLWDRYGDRIMYDSGLNGDSKVSQIIVGGLWKWPFPSSWDLRKLTSQTPNNCLPNPLEVDKTVWSLNTDGVFTIKSVWELWRNKQDTVP